MKKFILSLVLALNCSVALADSWTGEDKKLHLGAGFVISSLITMHTKDPWEGFKWGVIAGAAKEATDAMGMGEASAKDFVVTAIGSAIGAYTGGLIVTRIQGTTTVAYNITLK